MFYLKNSPYEFLSQRSITRRIATCETKIRVDREETLDLSEDQQILAIFSLVTKESRKRAKEKGTSRHEGEIGGTGWKRNVKERNGGKIGGRKDLGNIRGWWKMTGLDRKKVYRTASSRQSIFNSARSSRRKQFSRLERRKNWKIVSSICPRTLEKSKIRFLWKKEKGCTDVFYRRKGWKELPWKIHPKHAAQLSQTLVKKKKKEEERLVKEQRLVIIASFSFNECSSTARTSVIGLFSVVGTRWKRYRP